MTRVLIAPQEFKGTLRAAEAAAAIAAGIREARPGVEIDVLPFSDGGPGFLDAIRAALPVTTIETRARDAVGRPVAATFAMLGDGTAVIEAAEANGLWRLASGELAPLTADTRGVGDLLLAAVEAGARTIIVGMGGSATTDVGAGLAVALGARLLDASGRDLPPGGGPLEILDRITWDGASRFAGITVIAATDVDSPLTGPAGAAHVFGPQKGATPADIEVLETGLRRFAEVVRRDLGVELAALPGAGAAGGLAAGLVAFLGARIVSGFEIVAEVSGLDARLAQADVVVTGEGRFDGQSLAGKTTGRLIARAAGLGKPCIVFAGRTDAVAGGQHVRTIVGATPETAGHALRTAAAAWAREALEGPG